MLSSKSGRKKSSEDEMPIREEWKEATGQALKCNPGAEHCWHRLRWSVPTGNGVAFLDNAKKGEKWETCCWCGKRRLNHQICYLVQTHGDNAPELRFEAESIEEWGS